MKYAISTDAEAVSAHFGRCAAFTIVEVSGGKTLNRQVIDNPGHEPGFLPGFLRDLGVECVVAGGAGRRAILLFEEKGILLITGVSGPIEDIIGQIERGELRGGESMCRPGAGKTGEPEDSSCHHQQKEN